ncbi:unnamed protein product, partial [Phaeothamnion confervicola]
GALGACIALLDSRFLMHNAACAAQRAAGFSGSAEASKHSGAGTLAGTAVSVAAIDDSKAALDGWQRLAAWYADNVAAELVWRTQMESLALLRLAVRCMCHASGPFRGLLRSTPALPAILAVLLEAAATAAAPAAHRRADAVAQPPAAARALASAACKA